MKPSNQAGFTIIETMLFLGITGLLIMGVLVGAGTSINIQRYHDSVTSLQSVLQRQFSEVSNVSRDSADTSLCGGGLRGQSDCVILGRFVTTINDQKLSIKSVIGTIPNPPTASTDDVDVLKDYKVQVSDVNSETYDVEWGASLVRPGGNTSMAFSMLILRSPTSGVVRTFINPNASIDDSKVQDLIDPLALTQPAKVCVDSNGLFTGGKSAVIVMANTSSASGIETQGEATNGC